MKVFEKKVLGVVNPEPISEYIRTGFSLKQLEEYYNPRNYFDSIHIFAYGDKEWKISEKVYVHPLSGSSFSVALQLIKYCIKYEVCIIKNFESTGLEIITAEVKNILKIPAIISLHSQLYPPAITAYDHIFAYVEWFKRAIEKSYNYHNVTILLNRIDEKLFKPGSFKNVPRKICRYSNKIISIGRLCDKEKNHSTLIKAMAWVVKKYSSSVLVIIGEGDERQEYEKLIDKLNLCHNVYLIGNRSQKMLVEYLNWCDFHVLCNPHGDLGRSITESLIVGKPVIATGGKGNSKYHLSDGFNARIVRYRDIHNPKVVAAAIIYMIKNKNRFDKKAIRKRAISEYGLETLSKLEISIYGHILKNHKYSSVFIPMILWQKSQNIPTTYRTVLKRLVLYFYVIWNLIYKRIGILKVTI